MVFLFLKSWPLLADKDSNREWHPFFSWVQSFSCSLFLIALILLLLWFWFQIPCRPRVIRIIVVTFLYWATSLVAKMVNHLPAMREIWVWSLGWEDPWRRKWQPTPVFLPGESHGRRNLVGYSPWRSQRVGHDWTTSLSLFLYWNKNSTIPCLAFCL